MVTRSSCAAANTPCDNENSIRLKATIVFYSRISSQDNLRDKNLYVGFRIDLQEEADQMVERVKNRNFSPD